MMSFLRKNLFYKVASLILAVFLWLYVSNAFSGAEEFNIPLQVIGEESNMIIENLPQSVTIRVQKTKEMTTSVNKGDFTATINLKEAPNGQHTYPINVKGPDKVQVVSRDPSEVILDIDRTVERDVPLVVRAKAIPEGYLVMEAYAKPTTVKIAGPSLKINEIKQVVAELAVEPLNTLQTGAATLNMQDEKGQVLDQANIKILSGTVNASIRLASEKVTDQKRFDALPIGIQGALATRTYKLGTTQGSVTLEGLLIDLLKIKAENIKLQVDVSTLEPGTHDVPIKIVLPAGSKAVRIQPDKVTITVQDKLGKEGGNTGETPNGKP